MKQIIVVCAVLLAFTIQASAQSHNNDQVLRYIERYRALAMSEQQRTGIPASIILAQAIHETGAGTSKLATEANNHFGLKCKSDWQGETIKHRDDRRNECFRKYSMEFESYQDYSNYLRSNPRYAQLFDNSVTDYAAWAFGLRQAGYATNPQYAQLLIKLIEDYRLQEYTYAAMGNSAMSSGNVAQNNNKRQDYGNSYNAQPQQTNTRRPSYDNTYNGDAGRSTTTANNSLAGNSREDDYGDPDAQTDDNNYSGRTSKYIDTKPTERQTVVRTRSNGRDVEYPVQEASTVVKVNNLKAVYGKRGDMPLQYAVRNNIRYKKFLEINDLEQDQPLPADMPLYLERKHFWGIRPMHLVKPGETMLVIAQQEGIQLKYLRDLNYMEADEEPMPGQTLELQAQAGEKPKVMKRSEMVAQGTGAAAYQPYKPTSTFPKNPAPVYEEKNFFDKLKEKLSDSKEEDNKPQQQTQNRQQYAQRAPQQQVPQTQQPVQQEPEQSKYIQQDQPQQQLTYQTRQAAPQQTQQRTQSYSSQQYSNSNSANTSNSIFKPNPAAALYDGDKEADNARTLSKRERRKRNKEQEEAAQSVVQQPVQQQPKQPETELDKLKAQFDDVIYADNSGSNNAPQTKQQYNQQVQQPQHNTRQQPKQQNYQQPQQNYSQQQQYQPQQQNYGQQQYQQQPQQNYNQQYNNQQSYNQQNQYANQQTGYAQQQQYGQNQYGSRQGNYGGNNQQAPPQQYDPTKFYTVEAGDTAYTIAKKHGITIRQLMDMNGLDFDEIKQGQRLRVKP